MAFSSLAKSWTCLILFGKTRHIAQEPQSTDIGPQTNWAVTPENPHNAALGTVAHIGPSSTPKGADEDWKFDASPCYTVCARPAPATQSVPVSINRNRLWEVTLVGKMLSMQA